MSVELSQWASNASNNPLTIGQSRLTAFVQSMPAAEKIYTALFHSASQPNENSAFNIADSFSLQSTESQGSN